MFPIIVPQADNIIVTSLKNGLRTLTNVGAISFFAKNYKRRDVVLESITDPHQALKQVLSKALKDDCILVTGSFFLAGELREEYFTEKYILEERKSFK